MFAQPFQYVLLIPLLILILFHANVRIKIKKSPKMNAEIRPTIIALKDQPLILNFWSVNAKKEILYKFLLILVKKYQFV